MKQMRKLFLAVAMLAVSAVMMVTSSYAWFSMNKEVEAEGMVVSATASSSLVILKSPSLTAEGSSFVTFQDSDAGRNLQPVTYTDHDKNFQIPSDFDLVNPNTGVNTSELKSLEEDGNGTYYKDYVVYIAASGTALPNQKLNATLTVTEPTDAENGNAAETWKAVSVAYYVGQETVSTFTSAFNDDATELSNIHTDGKNVVQLSAGIDLPLSTTGFIPVTIRVYFDGNAGTDDAKLVRSSLVYTGDVKLSVLFTVE